MPKLSTMGYARKEALPSDIRKASSAHKLYLAAEQAGWTLDLHYRLYDRNGDVQSMVLIATWPDAPEDRFAIVELEFDPTSGALWHADRYHPNGKAYYFNERQKKIGDLVKSLSLGPIWHKQRLADEAEKARVAEAQKVVRDAQRKLIGEQPVYKETIERLQTEKQYAAEQYRKSLDNLIAQAEKVKAALDEGRVSDNVGGGVLYTYPRDVEFWGGKLVGLVDAIDRIEWAFGRVLHPYYREENVWTSFDERRMDGKDAEDAEEGDSNG